MFWITVQAEFVHCKVNGLDPFHPFRFQTNSMHADNITSFPGRRVESNYLNRSISNKQNLMFLLQLRRFGWHNFGGLLQSSSLQLPCISPKISVIMIITLMNVFWFQEFRSNTDDTIFKTYTKQQWNCDKYCHMQMRIHVFTDSLISFLWGERGEGANQQCRAGELPARTQMAPEKFSHVNACVELMLNL